MNKQLNILHKDKAIAAIEFIREHEPPEGYFIGFSGGKDSVVTLDLVQRAGVKHQAYYSMTGIDPPEIYRFIRRYFPEVVWLKPERSFFDLIPVKGFPTVRCRWCCDHLKKNPSKHIQQRHRIMGIRAEESPARASRRPFEQVRHPVKQWLYKPIFGWLEWEVWEYIEKNNLPHCPLYDEGYDRIGCVVCPYICSPSMAHIKRNKERWPGQYAAFERAMYNLWTSREQERQRQLKYSNTFDEFLTNWYRGLPSRGRKVPGQMTLWGSTWAKRRRPSSFM